MRVFDKTLEFINNCSMEDLTKELSGYGINFTEKTKLNRQNQESFYDGVMVSVSASGHKSSALLKFYSTVQALDYYYSPFETTIEPEQIEKLLRINATSIKHSCKV